MYKEKISDYIPEFAEKLKELSLENDKRWGDTWKKRPVEPNSEYRHQNERIYSWFRDKYQQWEATGVPINWLDVATEALICWIRENELKRK